MSSASTSVTIPVRLVAVITFALIQFLVAARLTSAHDLYEEVTQQLPTATPFNSVENGTEEDTTIQLAVFPQQENSTLGVTDQPKDAAVTILDESVLTTSFQEVSTVSPGNQQADINANDNNEKKDIDKNGRIGDITYKRTVVVKSDNKFVIPSDRKGELRNEDVIKNDTVIEGLVVGDDQEGGDGDAHDYDGILMKGRPSRSNEQKEQEPIVFKSDLDFLQQQLKYQNQELADLRIRLSKSDIALIDIETKFYKYLQTESLVSDGTEHKSDILLTQRFPDQDTKLKQIPGLFDCRNILSKDSDFFKLEQDFNLFREQVEDNLSSILKELDYLRSWRQDYLKQTTEIISAENIQKPFHSTSMSSEQTERDQIKEIKDNSSIDIQQTTSKVFENLNLKNNSVTKPISGVHLKYDFSNITSQTDDVLVSAEISNITVGEKIEEFEYFEKLLQEINQKVDTTSTRVDNLEENMMLSMENISQMLSLSQEILNGNITFLQIQINQIITRLDSKQNQSEINIHYEELKPNLTRLINDYYQDLKISSTVDRSYNDTTDKYNVLPIENDSKIDENIGSPFNYSINESWNLTDFSQMDQKEAYSDFSSELITVKQNFTELFHVVENIDSNYAELSQRLDLFSHQLSSIVIRFKQDRDQQNGLPLNKLSVKNKSVSSHLDVLNEVYAKDIENVNSKQNIGSKSNESFFENAEYSQNKTEEKLLKWISKSFFKNITSDQFLTRSDISETSKTGENVLCYNFSNINESNSEVSILKTFLEHLGSLLTEVKNHLNIMCSETNRTSDHSENETTITSSFESETLYGNISENSPTSENITFPEESFDTLENTTMLASIESTHRGIKDNINGNHSVLHNSSSYSVEEIEGKENKTTLESEQNMYSFGNIENKTLPEQNNFSGSPQSKHLELIYFEIETLSLRIDVLENIILSSNKDSFVEPEVNETIPFIRSDYRGSGSLDLEPTEKQDVLQNLISNLTQIQNRFECLNSNVQLQEKQLSGVKMDIFKLNERLEHFTQEGSRRVTENIFLDVENTKDDISKLIEEMSEITRQVSSFAELNLTDTLRNVKCHLEEHQEEIGNLKAVMKYQTENRSMVYWKPRPVEEKILYVDVMVHKRQKDLTQTTGTTCDKMKAADRIFFDNTTHTCYYAFNSLGRLLPYHAAKKKCEEAGLHLVFTETEYERQYIAKEITKVIGTHWIGAEKLGSNWFWVHGCEAVDPIVNIPWRYNHSVPYIRALVWADKWLGAGARRHARYVCEDEQVKLDSCKHSQSFTKIKLEWFLSSRQRSFRALHAVDCGRLCLADFTCQGFCFQKWGQHTCTLYGQKGRQKPGEERCRVTDESCYVRVDNCIDE